MLHESAQNPDKHHFQEGEVQHPTTSEDCTHLLETSYLQCHLLPGSQVTCHDKDKVFPMKTVQKGSLLVCTFLLNPSKLTGPAFEAKQTPKRQGLKSRLGTVMGRRKNAPPSPSASAEKPKKGKNRSSLMPFRRGESSRNQLDAEGTSTAGRPVSPAIPRREGNPTESSMRPVQTDQLPSGPTDVEAPPMTPVSSALVNGIMSAESHNNVAEVGGTPNRAPSFDNILTRPQQVTSPSSFFTWSFPLTSVSHRMSSASPHRLLFGRLMPFLVLNRKQQRTMRKSSDVSEGSTLFNLTQRERGRCEEAQNPRSAHPRR